MSLKWTNLVTAKRIFFGKGNLRLLSLFASVSLLLTGCASSNVSRDAESGIDLGVENAQNLGKSITDGSIDDTFGNASETAKGAAIGGTVGAVAGALAGGVGFVPGAGIGAVLGGSYGSYIDSNTTLKDQLENRGATMVVLGDQILIVIPSARLFDPWTSTIKPQAYSTLELVTTYINSYTKMLVKVSAYTDNTGSHRADLALSQQQAEAVAKTLTASGVDARVLYASGYGASRLVVKNSQDWDSDNYRIEITLEKLYV